MQFCVITFLFNVTGILSTNLVCQEENKLTDGKFIINDFGKKNT